MADSIKNRKRECLGEAIQDVCEIPNLIGIQLDSYKNFLQLDKIGTPEGPNPNEGLEYVFRSSFPMESQNGDLVLSFKKYRAEFNKDNPRLDELVCKKKGLTYSVPIKATIVLKNTRSLTFFEKEVFFGDIPLMTDRGTFIINGTERIVVSQIHRSPGTIAQAEKNPQNDKKVYSSRIIPSRGSWIEFEIDEHDEEDTKHIGAYVKIDRKKRILATLFLRAMGLSGREEIVKAFYDSETLSLSQKDKRNFVGRVLYKNCYGKDGNKILRAGDRLNAIEVDKLLKAGIDSVDVIDLSGPNGGMKYETIIQCFEKEEAYINRADGDDEPDIKAVLKEVFDGMGRNEIIPNSEVEIEALRRKFESTFNDANRFDLGDVGRYKINSKFHVTESERYKSHTLTIQDFIDTIAYLVRVSQGDEPIDDIDHLGNRRVRSVGELLTNQLKTAFIKVANTVRERMLSADPDNVRPQDLISIKPIVASIKEFFGSSQLSQFMDQTNPLSELTHKRRITALGPGGLNRERAGFEVRDVHYTHYGRMCPIETPEGQNIGLIVTLANYTKVNEYGFLKTPYRVVKNGKVTKEIQYLDAIEEEDYYIAQGTAALNKDGTFKESDVPVRKRGDYSKQKPQDISFMDVSPKQVISVAASLIPFLEHDDANRALMGSNMQRQAVPLLFPEAPRVGTGMEGATAYYSGVLQKARRSGTVEYVSASKIIIRPDESEIKGERDEYQLLKNQRTNQDTCLNQRPIVNNGDHVEKGDVIADGPATDGGELALGRNILVGFVPWNGYNYEDAVLISERVVKEDIYTSVHISEFSIDVRETKLGMEILTRDIPSTPEKLLRPLDDDGIIKIGTHVKANDILVGKVTPKTEGELSPEFALLSAVLSEKTRDVRDSSLRVPHGTEGVVIEVNRLSKKDGDELPPGVEEQVKVLIASKRKLRQGDKMAGRHGNKGVVSRILPEEDMPYMEDGTPLDVCLNPLGVPSRMNIGQLMETQLGWAGVTLNKWYETPVFQSATMDQIEEEMQKAGLPKTSKQWLYDGRTGEKFVNPVFCGYIYYLKLHHLVDDKMHARSIGPYSLVTQQPLGGKAQFGGQRFGEMEVWALEAYGAVNTLQEILTIKSDDVNGRVKVYESIVKGEPTSSVGTPEAFNVLVQEVRGLCLDMEVFDSNGKQVPLTERDDDIISNRIKTN